MEIIALEFGITISPFILNKRAIEMILLRLAIVIPHYEIENGLHLLPLLLLQLRVPLPSQLLRPFQWRPFHPFLTSFLRFRLGHVRPLVVLELQLALFMEIY